MVESATPSRKGLEVSTQSELDAFRWRVGSVLAAVNRIGSQDPRYAGAGVDEAVRGVVLRFVGDAPPDPRYRAAVPADMPMEVLRAMLANYHCDAVRHFLREHRLRIMEKYGIRLGGWGLDERGGRFVIGYDPDHATPGPDFIAELPYLDSTTVVFRPGMPIALGRHAAG
ncbi:hypothetical protein GIS00_02405 [Nakamurella sp. YIM 132087]|uniref:Uncharacterized protein n=1 Tax=Nakamurella alba TaxID=2665158 RepID=A0A7K1FFE5_9ACTN|nr:hypothetical protein [Nakamurella alba]MTD12796.1 hypothetical protein [Nakamurella alba]